MNKDRPTFMSLMSAKELLHTESTFQQCIDYVDTSWHS